MPTHAQVYYTCMPHPFSIIEQNVNYCNMRVRFANFSSTASGLNRERNEREKRERETGEREREREKERRRERVYVAVISSPPFYDEGARAFCLLQWVAQKP